MLRLGRTIGMNFRVWNKKPRKPGNEDCGIQGPKWMAQRFYQGEMWRDYGEMLVYQIWWTNNEGDGRDSGLKVLSVYGSRTVQEGTFRGRLWIAGWGAGSLWTRITRRDMGLHTDVVGWSRSSVRRKNIRIQYREFGCLNPELGKEVWRFQSI